MKHVSLHIYHKCWRSCIVSYMYILYMYVYHIVYIWWISITSADDLLIYLRYSVFHWAYIFIQVSTQTKGSCLMYQLDGYCHKWYHYESNSGNSNQRQCLNSAYKYNHKLNFMPLKGAQFYTAFKKKILECLNKNLYGIRVWRYDYQLIEAEWCRYSSVNHVTIGSDNDLSPVPRRTVMWTSASL